MVFFHLSSFFTDLYWIYFKNGYFRTCGFCCMSQSCGGSPWPRVKRYQKGLPWPSSRRVIVTQSQKGSPWPSLRRLTLIQRQKGHRDPVVAAAQFETSHSRPSVRGVTGTRCQNGSIWRSSSAMCNKTILNISQKGIYYYSPSASYTDYDLKLERKHNGSTTLILILSHFTLSTKSHLETLPPCLN